MLLNIFTCDVVLETAERDFRPEVIVIVTGFWFPDASTSLWLVQINILEFQEFISLRTAQTVD